MFGKLKNKFEILAGSRIEDSSMPAIVKICVALANIDNFPDYLLPEDEEIPAHWIIGFVEDDPEKSGYQPELAGNSYEIPFNL